MGIGFWGPQREFVGFHAAVAPSLFPTVSLFWKEMENGAEGGGGDGEQWGNWDGGMWEWGWEWGNGDGDGDGNGGMLEWGWGNED